MKKFASLILAFTMASTLCIPAFAAEVPKTELPETSVASTEVTPRISWSGTVYLNTSEFREVTTSNNIFSDRPLVKSHIKNPGSVVIRVYDEAGQPIGQNVRVAAGSSVRLDKIPAFSGTYTIEAMAISSSGDYTFSIT